nr:Arm DNA-binding domain-containing protein [uncultured Campylobacter sp.]
MANIAKQTLQDKDIRNLETKSKQYIKAVGNPKELYIWVNPSGMKTFSLRHRGKYIKIKEFRENIYSVAEARRDATKLLKELESGKDIQTIKGKSDKYRYKNLFDVYIAQKRKKNGISESYITKIVKMNEKYILPSFGERDIKTIKYSDILVILNAIFNPNNPRTSRLEILHRLINDIDKVFAIN